MKAIRIHGPDELVYEDAPEPRLRPGEVMVRVHAAAVTVHELAWPETWQTEAGTARSLAIPGHELSGVVVEIGEGVDDLEKGDAVFGIKDAWSEDGAQAELVAVRREGLASKPRSLDHVAASVVPISGLTAWQALVDRARLAVGQRVLVHGAAGGVGGFAVQLAHVLGAEVIATAAAEDAAFVRKLGADRVIDYKSQRFEDEVHDVDVVLDTIGGETLERSRKVLRPAGTLVSVATESASTPYFFYVEANRAELDALGRLFDEGELRPMIDHVLPIARAREAYEHKARRGKVVLAIA